MAPKSHAPLFFILFLSILVVSLPYKASAVLGGGGGGGGGRRFGGWKPIPNLKDPKVVEIAKFAVDEHNKQAKTSLELASLVKGETQTVAGTNYKLVITAKDGGGAAAANKYQAVVYDKPWQKLRQLTSFDEVK